MLILHPNSELSGLPPGIPILDNL
eukprot:COSAG02_NODE_3145_length_7289_cov_10.121280_8_plen_23_part_01